MGSCFGSVWGVRRSPRWGVKKRKVPLSYKRPRSTSQYKTRKIYNRGTEIFSLCKNAHRVALAKDLQLLYNAKRKSIGMRKNSEQNICPIEIDPVTDEYKITIPEWLINDMGWYEGMELNWIQDSDIVCIEEAE